MPGSYKLWFNYLRESRKYAKKNLHEFLKPETKDTIDMDTFTGVVA
jgi:hypothetical protein